MDITHFIRELILMNECVILRGIGGFETSYKHAGYKGNKKLLTPPSKKIVFHPEWIRDNQVLENHIARHLGISGTEASDIIDHFVQHIHNNLKTEGRVIIDGIGEFFYGRKETIQFQELENENYLADSFGLDDIDLPSVSIDVAEPEEVVLKPINAGPRKKTGLYITIGVLLLLISVTFIILISDAGEVTIFGQGKDNGVIVFGPPEKSDSISQSINKALDSRTDARRALRIDQQPVRQTPQEKPAPVPKYYLIAGSFNSRRNADAMNEQLTNKGFNSEVLIRNSQYRVVVGKFADRGEALSELRRLRVQLNQSIWLDEL